MGESKVSERNVTFAFGHAVGAGVQELFCGGSMEQAIWQMFLAWDVELFEVDAKSRKSFAWAYNALHKFLPYCRQILKDYDVTNQCLRRSISERLIVLVTWIEQLIIGRSAQRWLNQIEVADSFIRRCASTELRRASPSSAE